MITRHAWLCFLALATSAVGGTILTEPFDSPSPGWKATVRGKASVDVVSDGGAGPCLRIQSDGGFAYYSIAVDPALVSGKRLTVRSRVRLEDVRVGQQRFNTAKLHIGVTVAGELKHFPTLFAGSRDWHTQMVTADVPAGAEKVVVDLGIQEGFGTAWYDDVMIDDGVREHEPLDLSRVANTTLTDEVPEPGRGGFIDAGSLDLAGLPVGDVRLADVDFFVLPPSRNSGRACLVLGGKERPALPLRPTTAIMVQRHVPRLFFLHASAWADPAAQQPCLTYDIAYEDGQHASAVMREGIEIGSFQDPKPLPAWQLGWTDTRDGTTVGVGVTTWENPRPAVAILWLRPGSSGKAGVPIVLAVSAPRAEAPAP